MKGQESTHNILVTETLVLYTELKIDRYSEPGSLTSRDQKSKKHYSLTIVNEVDQSLS